MKRVLTLTLASLMLSFSACGGGSGVGGGEPVQAVMLEGGEAQKIDILVDHAYKPNQIVLKAGVPAQLNFYRREQSESCARDLEIPGLDINVTLPNNEKYLVEVPPQVSGTELPFGCTMDMMRGKITVSE